MVNEVADDYSYGGRGLLGQFHLELRVDERADCSAVRYFKFVWLVTAGEVELEPVRVFGGFFPKVLQGRPLRGEMRDLELVLDEELWAGVDALRFPIGGVDAEGLF